MFDIQTLFLSSAISRAAFLVVFVAIMVTHDMASYLKLWFGALCVSTAATLVMWPLSSHDSVPLLIAFIVYVLFGASLSLSWGGLRLFFGRGLPSGLLVVVTVLPGGCYLFLMPTGLEVLALFLVYTTMALMAAMGCYEIVRPSVERILSKYVVAIAFVLYFIALMSSGLLLALGHMSTNIVDSAQSTLLADQVSSIIVYFGFIAMASERTNLRFEQLAETDSLTGLLNRRGGNRALLRVNRRAVDRRRASVLLCDIDHFKIINDTYGHEAGDLVLKALAQRIGTFARASDTAARWGGEEFMIMLPDTDAVDAKILAERLRQLIASAPFNFDGRSHTVTLSVGVAETYPGDIDFEPALLRADEALYRAKRGGRNQVIG